MDDTDLFLFQILLDAPFVETMNFIVSMSAIGMPVVGRRCGTSSLQAAQWQCDSSADVIGERWNYVAPTVLIGYYDVYKIGLTPYPLLCSPYRAACGERIKYVTFLMKNLWESENYITFAPAFRCNLWQEWCMRGMPTGREHLLRYIRTITTI